MPLISQNIIIYRVPKTGNSWIFHVLHKGAQTFKEKNEAKPHLTPYHFKSDKFKIAFIRHPVSWYQACYVHRVQQGWRKLTGQSDPFNDKKILQPYESELKGKSFIQFMEYIFEARYGCVTNLYKAYLGKDLDMMDFVGKHENLKKDLILGIRKGGEKLDESHIINTPPKKPETLQWPVYKRSHYDEVFKMDLQIIKRYYPETL